MKTLLRKELVALCKEVFGREKMQDQNTLLVTEDGQIFVPNENTKSRVAEHAKAHNIKFFEITRAEACNGEAPPKVVEKSLEKMTKAELIGFGESIGLTLDEAQTKAEMQALIEVKLKESAGTTDGGEGTQE